MLWVLIEFYNVVVLVLFNSFNPLVLIHDIIKALHLTFVLRCIDLLIFAMGVLQGGMKCLKYCTFLFNFIVFVSFPFVFGCAPIYKTLASL